MTDHDILFIFISLAVVFIGVPMLIIALRVVSGAAEAILNSAGVAAMVAVGVVVVTLFARGSMPF